MWVMRSDRGGVARSVAVAATTTVSTTPTAAASESAPAATTATTAGTFFSGPGDVNVQSTPTQLLPIQGVNRFLRLLG